MSNRLLDRQIRLLEFLTSGDAIFGDLGGASLDRAPGGVDRRLLRLEARFSHQKRMAKIAAVFPKTFELINDSSEAMAREFVNRYPPSDIGRLENAQQFYDFICAGCEQLEVLPPFLCDVAACELACAQVRANDLAFDSGQCKATPRNAIRRDPGAVLVRCSYDVRPIFEVEPGADPVKRETLLGIAIPAGADQPQIFELLPPVFALLSAMDDWTDPTAMAAAPGLSGLIQDLSTCRLIEVHP
jgi:hypothetical protein